MRSLLESSEVPTAESSEPPRNDGNTPAIITGAVVGVVVLCLVIVGLLAVVVCLVVRVRRRRDGGKITDTSRGNNIHNPTYTGLLTL